jgi:hypothetical protein
MKAQGDEQGNAKSVSRAILQWKMAHRRRGGIVLTKENSRSVTLFMAGTMDAIDSANKL